MGNDPVERLSAFVEHVGGQTAAAKLIGCNASYLSLVLGGHRPRVGLRVAGGIERATEQWEGGQIRIAEWLSTTNGHDSTRPQSGTPAQEESPCQRDSDGHPLDAAE